MTRLDDLFVWLDATDFCQKEINVSCFFEETANGVDDLIRREHRCRYLIKERLEDLVVVVIDDQHIHRLIGQFLRRFDAADSPAEDDDTWPFFHVRSRLSIQG